MMPDMAESTSTAPRPKPGAPGAGPAVVPVEQEVPATPSNDPVAEAPKEETVIEKAPKVKLRPTDAVEHYPLTVSLVGLEEDAVFESESSTFEVSPEVAEQANYLTTVEVAE